MPLAGLAVRNSLLVFKAMHPVVIIAERLPYAMAIVTSATIVVTVWVVPEQTAGLLRNALLLFDLVEVMRDPVAWPGY